MPTSASPSTPPPPGRRETDTDHATPEELARLARAIAPGSLGDLGLEIPWRHRLATKIFAMIGIVSLGAVGAFAVAEVALQRHLFRQVVEQTDLLSATIGNSLNRAMLADHRETAYRVMEDIGRQHGIVRVRMLDKQGRITFSTARDEIGHAVDRRVEGCSGCHADSAPPAPVAEAAGRSRIYDWDGHRVMGIVTPIYNQQSCSTAACHAHPPDRKTLGVLDVGVSLQRVDAETHRFRLQTLAAAALAAVALGLFSWFFTRAHVIRPVAALVQATRRVARDQLELEIPVTWSGELGLLAASFNDMTRSLRTTKGDLNHLMEHLEHQVEERTAALKAAQDQLVRSEKLSSLGKLSASIAHEINNPLAGILTFAKLIVRTLEAGPVDDASRRVLVKNLLLVQRETERCSAIVRNLLDFARERPLTLRDVSVNAVVEEALQLLANQIQIQNVALERSLGPVPLVEGDFGQLRQAVVNVVMNACEAMGARGGALRVETRTADGDGAVEIVVTDTGPGISPEHLTKIFDPFFTTKEKGTGLGLSVVYGIVERHGGKVVLQSEVGKGTRIALRLPAKRGGAPVARDAGTAEAGA